MRIFRNNWSHILMLILLLASLRSQAQWKLIDADSAFPSGKRFFNVVGDSQPVTNADLERPRGKQPKIQLPPPHPAEIAESERDYAAGHFAEAAAHLKPLVAPKLVAPEVLYQYARVLYRVPGAKPQSFAAYQRLIALLDAYGREDGATCVVYIPFVESYFKLATMQMDNAQWQLAAYNLSRFLYALNAVPSLKTDDIYEQALQYQTECFAELGNAVLCRHYGKRTLKLFPQNKYVGQYLARLSPLPSSKTK